MTIKSQHMTSDTGLSILTVLAVLFKSNDSVWDGRIKSIVEGSAAQSWQLVLHVPDWCQGFPLKILDGEVDQKLEKG